MKTTIALLVLGLAQSAFAAPSLVSRLSGQTKLATSRLLDGDGQMPTPTPLRQDAVKVKMVKHTFTQQPDGSYKFIESDVCTKEGEFNVYEESNVDMVLQLGDVDFVRITCDSTMNAKPVKVNLGGAMIIGKAKLFEQPQDFKGLVGFLNIGPNIHDMQMLEAGAAATGDLKTSSLITNIQPSDLSVSCSADSEPAPVPGTPTSGGAPRAKPRSESCSTSMNEYFTATFEIKD